MPVSQANKRIIYIWVHDNVNSNNNLIHVKSNITSKNFWSVYNHDVDLKAKNKMFEEIRFQSV